LGEIAGKPPAIISCALSGNCCAKIAPSDQCRKLNVPERSRVDAWMVLFVSSLKDWELLFYPWYTEPTNVLDVEDWAPTVETIEYFKSLLKKRIVSDAHYEKYLSKEKIKFYEKTAETLRERIFTEFPTSVEEALFTSNEGSIYSGQILKARMDKRITDQVMLDTNTDLFVAFDLGLSDATALWVYQSTPHGIFFLDYYENNGKQLQHYINWLKQKYPSMITGVFMPHDSVNGNLITTTNPLQEMGKHFSTMKIPRTHDVWSDINTCRTYIDRSFFHATNCEKGLNYLENYSKAYNSSLGIFTDTPRHDECSHGADAFRYAINSIHLGMIKGAIAHHNRVESGMPLKNKSGLMKR